MIVGDQCEGFALGNAKRCWRLACVTVAGRRFCDTCGPRYDRALRRLRDKIEVARAARERRLNEASDVLLTERRWKNWGES